MERSIFLQQAEECRQRNPGIRQGQAICCVANQLFWLSLGVSPPGEKADPFYDDEKISTFLDHLVRIGCLRD